MSVWKTGQWEGEVQNRKEWDILQTVASCDVRNCYPLVYHLAQLDDWICTNKWCRECMPTKRGERHLCLENNILCLKRKLSCTVHAVKDTKSNVYSVTSQCILRGGGRELKWLIALHAWTERWKGKLRWYWICLDLCRKLTVHYMYITNLINADLIQFGDVNLNSS